MTFRLHRLRRGDEALLARVAAEVFDEPVRPERLGAYLASPDHLKVVALDGDTVVGQCAGVAHLHPDKLTGLYVDEVGTSVTHRRQSISRAMIREILAWGREIGCEEA